MQHLSNSISNVMKLMLISSKSRKTQSAENVSYEHRNSEERKRKNARSGRKGNEKLLIN